MKKSFICFFISRVISNMARLRNALIERDIIYSEMRQLYITDPVFTLWFRQRFW